MKLLVGKIVKAEGIASTELIKGRGCWMPVAHTCNPSYSGGRDQEDCGLKPDRENSL
jgi:hypothetical protein